jgi:beta-galactosidase beta subunit
MTKAITQYSHAADQAYAVKSVELRRALQDAIESAAQNAYDSVSEGHDESEWESIFIATLEGITTERGTPKAVINWFARRGIRG